jgi:hypothetical protein
VYRITDPLLIFKVVKKDYIEKIGEGRKSVECSNNGIPTVLRHALDKGRPSWLVLCASCSDVYGAPVLEGGKALMIVLVVCVFSREDAKRDLHLQQLLDCNSIWGKIDGWDPKSYKDFIQLDTDHVSTIQCTYPDVCKGKRQCCGWTYDQAVVTQWIIDNLGGKLP